MANEEKEVELERAVNCALVALAAPFSEDRPYDTEGDSKRRPGKFTIDDPQMIRRAVRASRGRS